MLQSLEESSFITHIESSVPSNSGIELLVKSSAAATQFVLSSVTLSGWGFGLYLHREGPSPSVIASLHDVACNNNSYGFRINDGFPDGMFVIEGGEATGNLYGFHTASPLSVHGCSIHDNSEYDVYVQGAYASFPSIDFRYNDWGPATTTEMQVEGIFSDISTIYDWWDDNSRSLVDYSGFQGGTAAIQQTSWGAIKQQFR